jgi:hypothetical protein
MTEVRPFEVAGDYAAADRPGLGGLVNLRHQPRSDGW